MRQRFLGKSGLQIPVVTLGTSSLGNLYAAHPEADKLSVLRAAFAQHPPPVMLDSAGKYGAGLSLEVIGRGLRRLGVSPDSVLISNKLGWRRVPLRGREPTFEPGIWFGLEHDAEQDLGYDGILRCWEQGSALLGAPYRAALVSVHDPDEHLARARTVVERERAEREILEAYRALADLKRAREVSLIGVGAKDWRVVRWLVDRVELDWVMIACSLTVRTHSADVVEFVDRLGRGGLGVFNSAVFHAGFLAGGPYFDYRQARPSDPRHRELFAWRERFFACCRAFALEPAAACLQFGLSHPAVSSIAVSTIDPGQVRRNAELPSLAIPTAFWDALRDRSVVRRDYPYLP